jgi:hypothetical protein
MFKTKTDLGSFLPKGLMVLAIFSCQNLKLTPNDSSLLSNTKVLKEIILVLMDRHQGMAYSQS